MISESVRFQSLPLLQPYFLTFGPSSNMVIITEREQRALHIARELEYLSFDLNYAKDHTRLNGVSIVKMQTCTIVWIHQHWKGAKVSKIGHTTRALTDAVAFASKIVDLHYRTKQRCFSFSLKLTWNVMRHKNTINFHRNVHPQQVFHDEMVENTITDIKSSMCSWHDFAFCSVFTSGQ